MSDSDKIILRSRLAIKMPPYDFAIIESERMVEIHFSPEADSASLQSLERDANAIDMSIRDEQGEVSIDAANEALSELVLRDFKRSKKRMDKAPARVWEIG